MAVLTVQTITASGRTPSFAAAAGGGDKFSPGDRVFLHVKNGGGGSVTVTVDDYVTQAPAGATAFDPDLTLVIPPSGEKMVGPLPGTRFRNSDGYVHVTYSGVTSVTVAAFKV